MDAVFAHMLLCMALSTEEIHALVGEGPAALTRAGAGLRRGPIALTSWARQGPIMDPACSNASSTSTT